MIRIFFMFLFLPVAKFSMGQQSLKEYVQQKAVPVNSIDPAAESDEDLEAIASAIGDSRIVMLGEQDHGDAPAFLAKTRLIKFLHEKKGFNVLAFESDFFGLNTGWDQLDKGGSNIDSFLIKNIFPLWTLCNSCSPLFYDYIPATYKTSRPLQITGFDDQLILAYSWKNLSRQFDSILKYIRLDITHRQNYSTEILPLVDSLMWWYFKTPKSENNLKKVEGYLMEIRGEASSKLKKESYWLIVIDNLLGLCRSYLFAYQTRKPTSGNIRDEQMARNLRWLSTIKYREEKIIVWAANFHVSKSEAAPDSKKSSPVTMGTYFIQDSSLAKQTYILGFTSYQGKAGRLGEKTFTVAKPKSGSIETWFKKDWAYSFVDLKEFNHQFPSSGGEFYMKGFGHYNSKQAWANRFDGIFFIRQMYPCQSIRD